MKKIDLNTMKFILVESCIILMLIISFPFWLQPYLEYKEAAGSMGFILTGFDLALGKTIDLTTMEFPTNLTIIEFDASTFAQLSLIFTGVIILIQLSIIVIRLFKIGPKNLWHVLNFISAGLSLMTGLLCFLAKVTYQVRPEYNLQVSYDLGSNLTGIFITSMAVIMLLNSIELFQKPQQQKKI